MEDLVTDILEQILIRFNLKELARLKLVCKSWYSFISTTRFHLKHVTHNNNNNNNNILQTRIYMTNLCHTYIFHHSRFFDIDMPHLLGSSNGLVCISQFHSQLLVSNPFTREVRKLENLPIPYYESFCWGFGYDLVTDDYKVVVGFRKGNNATCFKMLSLKSNVWKGVGDVKYSIFGRSGILCNGAVYWFMNDKSKKIILSFDLSKDEFKEIPQPDDKSYRCTYYTYVGYIQECLCIYRYYSSRHPVWVMKNYNGKQSWEPLLNDREVKTENAFSLRNMRDYSRIHKSFFNKALCFSSTDWIYMGAHVYVKSLVSPYINGKPNRQSQTKNNENNQRNIKLIKGEPLSVRV